ncbi:hypothetical protein [Paenibacillus prosopidis]|uniref:Uncharacterized protein n=1 Tax=Paenibacillus prosopidis TaxID=630520 RepID=A0A368VHF4_9BACL|nr:hypothetical protein [Paenibacillus prosopidis]RCW40638.1 hypothetical protein DFP97_13017 [Paenibacillus prosopidis]
MLPLSNKITLSSIDNSAKLELATRYLVRIKFTFGLTAVTKFRSHTSHFCVRKEQIEDFVHCINSQEKVIELQVNDSDGYIRIQFQKNNIIVRAQISGSYEDNIYIEFITGSKALLKFTGGLRDLLSFEDAY